MSKVPQHLAAPAAPQITVRDVIQTRHVVAAFRAAQLVAKKYLEQDDPPASFEVLVALSNLEVYTALIEEEALSI